MKYEFTGETKQWNGITLKQIRAIIAIEKYKIEAGALGGWIENEANLSQSGDAWVSGDAVVSGNAKVYGNAVVSGNAKVYGDAMVSGDAWVCDGAWATSPLYIQGTKYALYMVSENKVGCGCQIFTFKGWHKNWRRIAARFGMSEAEQAEYVNYFNLACERYGKAKYKIDIAEVDDG